MEKVVLISGASSGIGEATAEQLLSEGYAVYAGARRTEKMRALGDKGARILALDVTSDSSLCAAVETVLRETGRIDVLINNAGYGSYGAIEDVPLEEARQQFEVNVFGLGRLTQLALPHMRNQRAGKIINITSVGGKIHEPLGGWYHATKFAVEGWSDCLRMELKPFGIDVIVVEPGAIKTEWGGIARTKVLAFSGHTAYRKLAEERAQVLAIANDATIASSPVVVAKVIAKALKAKRPRARYATGNGAWFLVTYRKLASDKCMDWLMTLMAKRLATRKASG